MVSHRRNDDGEAKQGSQADWGRRRFLRRVATLSWMTPTILTITASRASAQASCASSGQSCAAISCCPGCNCSIANLCVGLC
jgi:hypothetical protein